MTGFGDAQLESEGLSFLIEIKSLNNKFLKTSIRLPDAMAFAEPAVERIIRDRLARGSVNYTMHLRHTGKSGAFDVNHAMLQDYLGHLEQAKNLYGGDDNLEIDLAALLQLPGVCQLRKYTEDEHKAMQEIIEKLTHEAIDRLQEMRTEEGKRGRDDLLGQCQVIQDNLESLAGMAETVVNNYRQRIQQRVDAMLAEANLKVDEDLLMKEVAIFAERCDINEEISRLTSHMGQFRDACDCGTQAGRRLDFLTQEMLREANTIASKANNAQISHHVVEIKVAIDRLREQVQNIE